MEILKTAQAGTLESSDVTVTVSPGQNGLEITIDSPVLALYEDQIIKTVREAAGLCRVENACISLKDRGAIDCVIKARTIAAICRAAGTSYDWTNENRAVEA